MSETPESPQKKKGVPSGVHYGLCAAFGAIFLIIGVGKILDPINFKEVVIAYQLPFMIDPYPAIVAVALPWLEIICGMALIVGLMRSGALFVLNSALVVFVTVKVYNWYRGVEVDCGCGGVFQFIEFDIPKTVALLAVGVLIAVAGKFLRMPEDAA